MPQWEYTADTQSTMAWGYDGAARAFEVSATHEGDLLSPATYYIGSEVPGLYYFEWKMACISRHAPRVLVQLWQDTNMVAQTHINQHCDFVQPGEYAPLFDKAFRLVPTVSTRVLIRPQTPDYSPAVSETVYAGDLRVRMVSGTIGCSNASAPGLLDKDARGVHCFECLHAEGQVYGNLLFGFDYVSAQQQVGVFC